MGKLTFHPVKSLQSDPKLRMLCLFGIEGFLLQYAVSLYSLANNLYATNLGATDTQIGLVQMVPNMVAGICMIPVGFLANRTKTSRTVPFVLALFLSAAYFAYGSVPLFGEHRMTAFFVFLGMTVGGIALYNAQWQTFFGDAVEPGLRNSVFTFRSRCLFFVGIVVPLLCGNIMTLMPDTEGKLIVLRIFFYIAGVCMLLQALVLRRIPCPPRKAEEKQEMGLKMFPEALNQMVRSKPFRGFFICIMLFYLSWHLDWSLWYIAETKYAGMNEAQLSFFQALCSICQMIFIGFFSKLCRRKSEHFTIIFVCAGLLLCPITVASMTLLPQSARMPYFMILALIGNIPQGATNMCVVQLLLQATPKKKPRAYHQHLHAICDAEQLAFAVLRRFGLHDTRRERHGNLHSERDRICGTLWGADYDDPPLPHDEAPRRLVPPAVRGVRRNVWLLFYTMLKTLRRKSSFPRCAESCT